MQIESKNEALSSIALLVVIGCCWATIFKGLYSSSTVQYCSVLDIHSGCILSGKVRMYESYAGDQFVAITFPIR